MGGLEIVRSEHAVPGAGRFMVGAMSMSVVQEQVSIAHALMGFVMRQADQSPQGSNVGLRCWEIRNELEEFGAGEDPDLLLGEADRPPGELLEDALDVLEAIPAAESQALEAFLRSHAEFVTDAYAAQVGTVVRSEQVVVSARALMSTLSKPHPVDVAVAGQRGRWVPLPAGSPPAQQLLDTTGARFRRDGRGCASTGHARPLLPGRAGIWSGIRRRGFAGASSPRTASRARA